MDLGKHSIASSVSRGSAELLEQFKDIAHVGMTITCPGFYAPQGRNLRVPAVIPDLIERFASFRHFDHKILNFEMETAAIYGLGQVFGHRCLSLSTIVANRVTGKFSSNMKKSIEKLIETTLTRLC
jgi:uridine phosphorylase